MTAFISYGGGVQSTAMVVLAVEGRLGYDVEAALFSNVGDDSEHPASLAYVRDVVTPWAADRGLRVEELHTRDAAGNIVTLRGEATRPGAKTYLVPAYIAAGGLSSRSCTQNFKLRVVTRRLRELGASSADPVDVLIGISVDEIERAGRGRDRPYERRRYPLLDLGLNRSDCEEVIRSAGLPVPGKSSCYFCPFHRPQTWAEMRRDDPDLFDQAQTFEDAIAANEVAIGRVPVFLTRHGRRLSDEIREAQGTLFGAAGSDIGEGGCDEGYCWT